MNAARSGWRGRLEGAAGLLTHNPRELFEVLVDQADRAAERVRARPSAEGRRPLAELLSGLGAALGADLEGFLAEDAFAEIQAELLERTRRLASEELPFPLVHNASESLSRPCYALTRALRPAAVLETGVAYGRSSSFILRALELNGHGELHSVDRPPTRPGVEDYVGALVPEELRDRWTLHRGTSRRLLPALLPRLEGLSLFIHDSQHTYRNMSWELRTVTPRLARPAAVLVDDTAGNRAFDHWVERERPAFSGVAEREMVGMAALPGR